MKEKPSVDYAIRYGDPGIQNVPLSPFHDTDFS